MLHQANTALFLWMTASDDPATVLLAFAQSLSFWPLLLALPALRLWAEHRTLEIWRLAAAVPLSAITVLPLQYLIASPRPFMLGLGWNFAEHAATYGLPSAHATIAAACWTVVARNPQDAGLGLFFVGMTMWARIYLGAHFPLDVVAGAALGAVIGWTLRASDPAQFTPSSQS